MYAIIESGGKQHKVKAGDILRVEKIQGDAGSKIKIDKVLAVNDGDSLTVGTPYVEKAVVEAKIISEGKGDKVIIFKFKAKKDYRKKQGHRQPYTELEIESIKLDGKVIDKKKAAPKKKAATKKAKEAGEIVDETAVEETNEAEVVEVAEDTKAVVEETLAEDATDTEDKPAE
jgi:large subunit ribosomal protein L21